MDRSTEGKSFLSLRVVNNDDGDDNEAIYGHALAHVLPSTSRQFEFFANLRSLCSEHLREPAQVEPVSRDARVAAAKNFPSIDRQASYNSGITSRYFIIYTRYAGEGRTRDRIKSDRYIVRRLTNKPFPVHNYLAYKT